MSVNKDEGEVVIPDKDTLLGNNDPVDDLDDGDSGDNAPQLSETEQRAMSRGWTPKDQWKGNPADWRPADVWLDRGEMLGTIQHLREELGATKKQVAEAFNQGRKLAQARFDDELKLLRELKREALQEQDFVKADTINERIGELKEKANSKEVPPPPDKGFTPPPEFNVFLNRNPWYTDPQQVRKRYIADGIGIEYTNTHPNASPADLYYFVEQEMEKMFPDLSSGGKKGPPQPEDGTRATRNVAATGKGSLSSVKASMSDLERQIMKTVLQTTDMTEEQYLKDYQRANRS